MRINQSITFCKLDYQNGNNRTGNSAQSARVTEIRYELPFRERVVLTFFDILGRRDASKLASGVFLFTLNAGGRMERIRLAYQK